MTRWLLLALALPFAFAMPRTRSPPSPPLSSADSLRFLKRGSGGALEESGALLNSQTLQFEFPAEFAELHITEGGRPTLFKIGVAKRNWLSEGAVAQMGSGWHWFKYFMNFDDAVSVFGFGLFVLCIYVFLPSSGGSFCVS